MKKLILIMVLSAIMSAPALAIITIPWESNEYGTHAMWTFDVNTNQTDLSDPDRTHWSSIPEDWYNPYSVDPVAADIYVDSVCPGTGMLMGWNPTDTSTGRVGIYYGDDDPLTLDRTGIEFNLEIPNAYNPDLIKIVQAEFVYSGELIASDLYACADVSLISDTEIYLGSGYYDRTLTWMIYPQPGSETVYLAFSGSGGLVDSIEVATICIPEPGAILLGGIGVCLVGWLRRRGTL